MMMNPEVEQMLFSLQPGQISPVIEWPQGWFNVYECVQHFPARDVNIEAVHERLRAVVESREIHKFSEELRVELQSRAQIDMIADNPMWAQQFPHLHARVNGREITRDELARLCIERHGDDVLEEMIGQLLILQESRRHNIVITAADIENDIRETASRFMRPRPDGSPNVEEWLNLQLRESGVSLETYKRNTVLPALALRRLAFDTVEVTEEDIHKGFEANFGPRARCLAIVLDNARRAQEIWALVRNTPNPEFFADLSATHSVDIATRNGRGVIPLIQRNSGQPLLEDQAFRLRPGEISEIFQLNGQFVILFGLGQTEQVVTDINEVRDIIYQNIFDKKLQLAMMQTVEQIYRRATITNHLTGARQIPAGGEMPQTGTVRVLVPIE